MLEQRKQTEVKGTGACELTAREITVNLLRCGLIKNITITRAINVQPPMLIRYGDLSIMDIVPPDHISSRRDGLKYIFGHRFYCSNFLETGYGPNYSHYNNATLTYKLKNEE